MTEFETMLEQARLFVVQHAPGDLLQQAVPCGLICLVAGIGLSVLGAKLARVGVSCAFAVLGGCAGAYFGRETGFPMPICIAVGALAIGVVGYHTLRMWVGVAAAVILTVLALGLFSYQRVMPHMPEYQRTTDSALIAEEGAFTVPSTDQQQAYTERTPRQWAEELWAFAAQKDARLEHNGKAIGLVAMAVGLCLGVVAVRWALILSTSVVGTVLVTVAMATLMGHFTPGSYQAFQHRPVLAGVGIGGFLVTSLIVQTLLTRKAPRSKQEANGKS
jgi:hypothetical protein